MSTPPDIIRDRVGTAVIIEEGGLSAADAMGIRARLEAAEDAVAGFQASIDATIEAVEEAFPFGYEATRTIQFVGDLHYGLNGATGDTRRATFMADSAALNKYIAHRVYVGDIIETAGNSGQIAAAKTALYGLDWRSRWSLVAGNHDFTSTAGSGTSFLAGFDQSSRLWVRDLGFVRLIGLTPDRLSPVSGDRWLELSALDLAWLGDRLAETTVPCVIVAHAPLYGSTTTGPFVPTTDNWYMHPKADIEAVLAAHDNAVMWVAGHTHTTPTASDIVKQMTVGSRTITHLNTSAIVYVAPDYDGDTSVLYSPFVTFGALGKYRVYWRNHQTGAWVTSLESGSTMNTLPTEPTPGYVGEPYPTSPVKAIISPDGSANTLQLLTPTVPAGITVVSGQVGNAWDFAEGGNRVYLPIGDVLSSRSGFIAFWAKVDAFNTGTEYLAYMGDGSTGGGKTTISIQAKDPGGLSVSIRESDDTLVSPQTSSPAWGSAWHLVYVGWDADGIELGMDDTTLGGTATVDPSTGPFAGYLNIGGTYNTNGAGATRIGPVTTGTRRLTLAERRSLMYRTAPWRIGMMP